MPCALSVRAMMNMPEPMTRNNYDKLSKLCGNACEIVAEKSMTAAAEEIKSLVGTEIGVSNDGSWQRRGYSSLNGVVTTISVDSGKILDVEAMSKTCRSCEFYERIRATDPTNYDCWKATHVCTINYRGSVPAMEPEGTKRIFERSVTKHGLKYSKFYRDGDSKLWGVES